MPCMSAMQALAAWNAPSQPVNAATIRVGRCACNDPAAPFAAEVILNGQVVFTGGLKNQDVTSLTSGLKAKVTVIGPVSVTTDLKRKIVVPCPPPN